MAMSGHDADLAAMAEARAVSVSAHPDDSEKSRMFAQNLALDGSSPQNNSTDGLIEPTEEELRTLRRVSGKIPWTAYTVTFVEFAERFSYYGTTVVFVNFIQQPRPFGSRTGAINPSPECIAASSYDKCVQPGMLGEGQQASTGLTTFNQFWAYIMPLFGGYIADTFLGRYNTIQISIIFAIVGHVILVVSALPQVADVPNGALGAFVVGLIIMGIGTGGFKSNISPLLAEQLPETRPYVTTTKKGERVIVDPAVTYSRVFLYFYMMINLGSLAGQIGMVYAERLVGFWLSFALPTFVFLIAPVVLIIVKPKYKLSPPTGSVLSGAFKLLGMASKDCWAANPVASYRNFRKEGFWDKVKPSYLGSAAPAWMSKIDDAWVDQVARGFNACKVFFWLPLYWLAYNQMTNNLTSQSATMQLNGVPNDLINNFNPITLVIFIPIFDHFIYPALRKAHIPLTPIRRITAGFALASLAMLSATIIQYYIYKLSPCAQTDVSTGEGCQAPISVWIQIVPYALIGFSEIGASISGLEYAFSKAPENMRGLVMGVNLLQNSFSAALGQALLPLASDPLLIWNYATVTILAAVGGVGFWFTWRKLDAKEDALNMLPESAYKGKAPPLQIHNEKEGAYDRESNA